MSKTFLENMFNYKEKNNSTTIQSLNIIGLKYITCSISDNMYLLRNELSKNIENINLIDIGELNNNIYKNKYNLFCVQPFELTKIDFTKFEYKPSIFWVWEFKSLPDIFNKF